VLETLDAHAVRRWSAAAVASLEQHRAELDELNVFPVADSDTGTNLVATFRAAHAALTAAEASGTVHHVGDAMRALATGAVLGAVGNSGVIMSQVLRGVADSAQDNPVYDGAALRLGLSTAAEQAYAAVEDPVDGTILSVARAAADSLPTDAELAEVVTAAVASADAALRRTTEQLPQLARAGVVDAGARGYVLLLDALACTITGRPSELAELAPVARPAHLLQAPREAGSDEFGYEVQFLLHAPDEVIAPLRAELARLGDSVAVVGTGTDIWNVHVHVNDVGAAIEAGVVAGVPRRITVVRFADQVAARSVVEPAGSAVVAVAPGEGLGHLFEAEGVRALDGSAVADVIAAIRATGCREVVLLPNAMKVTGVAEAAADQVRGEGIRVVVVPTRSPVQGLAAVAVHDPQRHFDDDVVAMAEAAAATRFAEVMLAEEAALTSVGICQAGDVLGLIDGEVVHIGRGTVSVALALVDRLLGVGVELMTVLVGENAPANIERVLTEHVRQRSPLTDVSVYPGGQPKYPVIIGVE
jgi:DAK2 domain fusion protein YloV